MPAPTISFYWSPLISREPTLNLWEQWQQHDNMACCYACLLLPLNSARFWWQFHLSGRPTLVTPLTSTLPLALSRSHSAHSNCIGHWLQYEQLSQNIASAWQKRLSCLDWMPFAMHLQMKASPLQPTHTLCVQQKHIQQNKKPQKPIRPT